MDLTFVFLTALDLAELISVRTSFLILSALGAILNVTIAGLVAERAARTGSRHPLVWAAAVAAAPALVLPAFAVRSAVIGRRRTSDGQARVGLRGYGTGLAAVAASFLLVVALSIAMAGSYDRSAPRRTEPSPPAPAPAGSPRPVSAPGATEASAASFVTAVRAVR
mgnify:CR=1 FL=1